MEFYRKSNEHISALRSNPTLNVQRFIDNELQLRGQYVEDVNTNSGIGRLLVENYQKEKAEEIKRTALAEKRNAERVASEKKREAEIKEKSSYRGYNTLNTPDGIEFTIKENSDGIFLSFDDLPKEETIDEEVALNRKGSIDDFLEKVSKKIPGINHSHEGSSSRSSFAPLIKISHDTLCNRALFEQFCDVVKKGVDILPYKPIDPKLEIVPLNTEQLYQRATADERLRWIIELKSPDLVASEDTKARKSFDVFVFPLEPKTPEGNRFQLEESSIAIGIKSVEEDSAHSTRALTKDLQKRFSAISPVTFVTQPDGSSVLLLDKKMDVDTLSYIKTILDDYSKNTELAGLKRGFANALAARSAQSRV